MAQGSGNRFPVGFQAFPRHSMSLESRGMGSGFLEEGIEWFVCVQCDECITVYTFVCACLCKCMSL